MLVKGTFQFVALLVSLSIGPEGGRAARILLLPHSFVSHVRQHIIVGEELQKAGHEVHLVVSETYPMMKMFSGTKIHVLQHKVFKQDYYQLSEKHLDAYFKKMLLQRNIYRTWRENAPQDSNMCYNPLSDENLFDNLKELEFDIAVVDSFPMGRCLAILPYRLGIPFISMTTGQEPWLTRTPSLPSYVPNNMSPGVYTDKMSFWERLDNLWSLVDWAFFPGVKFLDDNFLRQFFKDKEPIPLDDLMGRAVLWLIDNDVAIDYPRPTMPNEAYIGGLTTKPAKPLADDIQTFLDNAVDGAILMTFGSTSYNMADKQLQEFLAAFRKIKKPIIWKYITVPEGVPNNVLVKSWLAQNDILGHPNIKLFITHGGSGGQFEALYHGVPTIGFPTFADQFYNCRRASAHGMGLCFDLLTFNADDLVNAVHDILTNESYAKNSKLRSKIYRDRPMTSRERTVYWVEHALKYGGDHLHSHALDMPWYKHFMLDIFGFLLAVIAGGSLVTVCCSRMVLNSLLAKMGKQKQS